MDSFKDTMIGIGGLLLSFVGLIVYLAVWGAGILIALLLGSKLLHLIGIL